MDPNCIEQPVGLFTQPNAANGDCLFLAIAQALNAYTGISKDAMAAHLAVLGLRFGAVTCTELRRLVYSLFLLPAPETDAILDAWRMVRSASPELASEYMQVMLLPSETPTAELTPAHRLALFQACMSPRICWGEETALEILECLLSIRCLVIVDKKLQTRSMLRHPDNFKPLLYIPLSLSQVHYQSVLWEDRDGIEHAAFSENELPDILLFLTQRDCGMIEVPYINLKHRIGQRVGEGLQGATVLPADAGVRYTYDVKMVTHLLACSGKITFAGQ